MNDHSDDEIVAEERRRWSLWNRTNIWSFLFWVVAALLLAVAINFGVPEYLNAVTGVPILVIDWLPLIVLALVWCIFHFYRNRFRPKPENMRSTVQKKLVEYYTRQQRWMFAAFIPLILYVGYRRTSLLPCSDEWFSEPAFTFSMIMTALALVLGPGFLNARYRKACDDEMNRALRGRATALGYVLAVTAMEANYLVSLMAPSLLKVVLPSTIASVLVIPTSYYVMADWWASRDG